LTTQGLSIYDDVTGGRSDVYNNGRDAKSSNTVKAGTKNAVSDDRNAPALYPEKQNLRSSQREPTEFYNDNFDIVPESKRTYTRTATSGGQRQRASENGNQYGDGVAAGNQSLTSVRSKQDFISNGDLDVRQTTFSKKNEGSVNGRYDPLKSDVTPRSKLPGGEVERKPPPYDLASDRKSHALGGTSTRDQREDFIDRYSPSYSTESSRRYEESPRSARSGNKTPSTLHEQTVSSSKSGYDSRSQQIAHVSGVEDHRSKAKKTVAGETDYRAPAYASDANKRSGSVAEKENRKLQWDDGWQSSPRKDYDLAYKEKTGNSNIRSDTSSYGEFSNEHQRGRMNSSLSLGRDISYSPREVKNRTNLLLSENAQSSLRGELHSEGRSSRQYSSRETDHVTSSSHLDPRGTSSLYLPQDRRHDNVRTSSDLFGRLLQNDEIETRLLSSNDHVKARRNTAPSDHMTTHKGPHHQDTTLDSPTSKKPTFTLRADLSSAKYVIGK